jgi:hypothetical protein
MLGPEEGGDRAHLGLPEQQAKSQPNGPGGRSHIGCTGLAGRISAG